MMKNRDVESVAMVDGVHLQSPLSSPDLPKFGFIVGLSVFAKVLSMLTDTAPSIRAT